MKVDKRRFFSVCDPIAATVGLPGGISLYGLWIFGLVHSTGVIGFSTCMYSYSPFVNRPESTKSCKELCSDVLKWANGFGLDFW